MQARAAAKSYWGDRAMFAPVLVAMGLHVGRAYACRACLGAYLGAYLGAFLGHGLQWGSSGLMSTQKRGGRWPPRVAVQPMKTLIRQRLAAAAGRCSA